MRDVAQAAGVSVATVSYSFNNPDRVSEEARRKVFDAVDELGFVVNSAARSMKTGGATGVGIVVGDIAQTFSIGVVRGAQTGARERGLSLLIANGDTHTREQARYVDLFDQERLKGIILSPVHDSSADIEKLRRHGSRVVVVNYHSRPGYHCTVLMDNDDVGYRAAQHLFEVGARRLAFAAGATTLQPIVERRQGIRRAVAEQPGASLLELDRERVELEDGISIAEEILALAAEERPDGIVAATGFMARGIIDTLTASGIAVPEEVALISTEENTRAWDGPIRISRMREPAFELGRQAALLLADEIAEGDAHVHRTIVLHADLVATESTLGLTPLPGRPAAPPPSQDAHA
ncbi:LacI family transcriptional regulator [Ruania alba]|uniref:LacI family transcriptional regulator n=2 Tax=Ruania alba TaxID=648782 RepID=A0A1H5KYA1_9MICO|nr:LacI family transcriptional regulator [Ruania alba]